MKWYKKFTILLFLSLLTPQLAIAARAVCSLKFDKNIPLHYVTDIKVRVQHHVETLNLDLFAEADLVSKSVEFETLPDDRTVTVKTGRSNRILYKCHWRFKIRGQEEYWEEDNLLINTFETYYLSSDYFMEYYDYKIVQNRDEKKTFHVKKRQDNNKGLKVALLSDTSLKYFVAYGPNKDYQLRADRTYINTQSEFYIFNESSERYGSKCIYSGDQVNISVLMGSQQERRYWLANDNQKLKVPIPGRHTYSYVGPQNIFTLWNEDRDEGCLQEGDEINLYSHNGFYVFGHNNGGASVNTRNQPEDGIIVYFR